MSLRVTTNSMVRNYNAALTGSLDSLNRTREKVYSGKQFTRAYQDPSGALRASELRRKADRNDIYLSTLTSAQSRQDTADSALLQIVSKLGELVGDAGLKAMNASTPETRATYATSLRQMQDALLQSANSQYGESYLFAGTDGGEMPFSKDPDGNILYRGLNVTTDIANLDKIYDEKLYIDLGMGLQVDNASGIANSYKDINGASAYNASFCGLKAFGYGSVNGSNPPISKNALQLIGQMAEELEQPDFDLDRFTQMREQLVKTHADMTDYNADVGVRSTFLASTKERLEDQQLNIAKQLDGVETAQPAAAITDYSYAQYIHNLVLKVGSSLLSNSFIDFMK